MESDPRESAMREAALGGSAELRSAVVDVSNLASGRFDYAHRGAKRLAAVIRFEARDGNWTELVASAWNEPRYREAGVAGLNPRIAPIPAPEGQAAIDEAIRMTVNASDGDRFIDHYNRRGDSKQWARMSNESHLWVAVAQGETASVLRTIDDNILRHKEALLDEAERLKRSGAASGGYAKDLSAARNLNDQRTQLLTFDAARRAGLRSPAEAALPTIEAMIEQRAARPAAVYAQLAPGVEAILSRAADQIRTEAEMATIRFDDARDAQKVLRVAQTADVSETIRKKLNEEADDLEARTSFARRFHDLVLLSEGNWPAGARKVEGKGYEPLFPYGSDAAYVRPAWDVVNEHAVKPVAKIAVNAIRAISADAAESLAKADEKLRHLYAYRDERNGVGRLDDAWKAIHTDHPDHYGWSMDKWRRASRGSNA